MTDPEVEILWPSSLPSSPAEEGQDVLRAAGIDADCMLLPTRRGAADIVLVLLTTAVMEPFLRTVFQKLAEDAHQGLKAFTDRLLKPTSDATPAPQCVVYELPTGGRVTFTGDVPDQGYEQAVGLDARNENWTWDSRHAMWVPS
ncbi:MULTISPECIES: hypothetical protein [Streptomyces]|uniref:Uncharacterized protein n=1 Tax=Streptomyces achromogenes TaxID=67255 RepID=A0ABU0PYJ9_STRAH|nr:hypothetical protein [Streptomyces achromogenes]MDQ0683485.1 hypothetical protein [Streptomyces achromogenes]MDQ0830669.1 hypothetical protein [Streptomyces achromogenes]